MAEELIIKNASQNLLYEAIRDLPVQPVHMMVNMVANGISYPFSNENDGVKRYISECAKNKIIPYSRASFVYHGDSCLSENLFVPEAQFISNDACPEEDKKLAADMWANGGKFYKLNYELDDFGCNNEGFEQFKKVHLENAVKNGYDIKNMELWLKAHYRGGYDEGYYCRSKIIKSGKDIEFFIANLEAEKKDKMEAFFSKLNGNALIPASS